MQALFRLWALPVSSVTSILLQNLHTNRKNTSRYISVILTMIHVNMRKKKTKRVEKYITLRAVFFSLS